MIQRILSILFVMLFLLSAAGPAIPVYATEESTNTDTTAANESDTTIPEATEPEATEPETTEPETTEPETTDSARVSGTCGSNISWVLDKATGTLTISGTGAIEDVQTSLWEDYSDILTAIIIQDGITRIGSNAFQRLRQLKTVSLPESLKEIGSRAFGDCWKLTSINLGDQIHTIGDNAFSDCESLSSVNIPASLTVINYGVFNGSGLKTVSIHGGIKHIEGYAFSRCNKLTDVFIAEGLTSMSGSVFANCYLLSNVTLPDSLETTNGNIFSSCPHLTEIKLPDKLTKISINMFTNCTSLKKVEIGSHVSSIHTSAFTRCSNLTTITVSSSNPYFCSVNNVIYNKSKTKLIQIPTGYSGSYSVLPGTQIIGEYAADDRIGITALHIPSSVKEIEQYAFYGCTSLSQITFSKGLTTLHHRAFARCTSLTTVTLPETLSLIKLAAFESCSHLTAVTFTGDAPEIKDGAFEKYSGIIGYYSPEKAHWDEAIELYTGWLTWTKISCNNGHTKVTLPAEAASCIANGITEGVECSVCGKAISGRKIIPALGHTFTNWVLVKAPTETENGSEERSCSVCFEKEQRTLPRIGEEESESAERPTSPTAPDTTQPDPTDDPTQQTQPDTQDTPTYTASPERTDSTTGCQEEIPDDQPPKIDSGDLIKFVCIGILLAGGLVVFLAQRKRA